MIHGPLYIRKENMSFHHSNIS